MDRLNLPKAVDEADALRGTSNVELPTSNAEVKRQPIENALSGGADESMQALRTALAADMQPLGDALFSAYQAGDAAAMQAALKKVSQGMPELAGDAANLSEVLAGQFADAFMGDEAEEVENAARSKTATAALLEPSAACAIRQSTTLRTTVICS